MSLAKITWGRHTNRAYNDNTLFSGVRLYMVHLDRTRRMVIGSDVAIQPISISVDTRELEHLQDDLRYYVLTKLLEPLDVGLTYEGRICLGRVIAMYSSERGQNARR